MVELPLESDELFVPVDAESTGALADVGLSAPRFFPSPLVSTSDGLICVGGRLAPEWLLDAYCHGIFPWPVWDDEPMAWWSLDPRAIFEFECVRVSRRLARTIHSGKFQVTCDRDFAGVIRGCGTAGDRQEGTWLTPAMIAAYCELHRLGHAHSIEVWHENELAGGTYGVAIGGLFAAESMFYRVRDASKVAVVSLLAHLQTRGYRLCDIQQWTPHTGRLGAIMIPRIDYLHRLAEAVDLPVTFGNALSGEPLQLTHRRFL
jgi:leucyl/phenylalanyl-tRNA--protein transferase